MNIKRIKRALKTLKPYVDYNHEDGLYYPRIDNLSTEFINLNKNLESVLQKGFLSSENALQVASAIVQDIKNSYINHVRMNDIYLKATKEVEK